MDLDCDVYLAFCCYIGRIMMHSCVSQFVKQETKVMSQHITPPYAVLMVCAEWGNKSLPL
jgi:hypothetical protein